MATWNIPTDEGDADDVFVYGTAGGMYVDYVVVTTFLNKMKKSFDSG